ncbi:ead/Ea22-like family protein [Klebsiella pneumoniae]|uniref:ead/Ea22-like family protein n=1 Tax=Klebsiella pneumoniae TaxID=573 RepID=UPI00248D0B1E|nr:ead/Ea22-like family protein [Klebsiella pneumoniae]WGU84783.1 ead/Ea22-like family protein [Klebsiella pneumoniae]HDH0745859.1 ead/Ea22-like family protein [Klebsiella pneumoniae]
MTTDITELAQSLKAAAEKATPGQWERGDGKHGGELLVYCDDALGSAVCEATSEYNAIPKYQRIDNLDFIALANPANVITLVEALEKAQQRIAELESRTVTVKLPTTRLWAGVTECYEKSDVIAAIRSAGMEVSDD